MELSGGARSRVKGFRGFRVQGLGSVLPPRSNSYYV